MANLVTFGRLCLCFLLVFGVYVAPAPWILAVPLLALVVIGLDAVDGWVARRRGEASRFGSVFDIAADRVVENVLWIVLADLDLVPVWVAIVFVTRGFVIDGLRHDAVAAGGVPFDAVRSPWGRALVSGRFIRGLYGGLKAVTFAWLLAIPAASATQPALWRAWAEPWRATGAMLTAATVALCLLRALPVVVDFAAVAVEDARRSSAKLAGPRPMA
jgi:CDP-diacylglycerol--glycerol-3-phosphate 3-phosphatidyltransferase